MWEKPAFDQESNANLPFNKDINQMMTKLFFNLGKVGVAQKNSVRWWIRRLIFKPKHRVFCIGFQKTGTTSLGLALKYLGYRVESTPAILRYSWLKDLHQDDGRLELFRSLFTNKYDACEDNPFPQNFEELYTLFPESKFILTLRDDDDWLRSAQNHFGQNPTPMLDYVYGKFKTCPIRDAELWKSTYQNHNERVIAFFDSKPEQLLIMRTNEMTIDRLAKFLEVSPSRKTFPHENKRQY
jgi:hypothetical protein